MLRCSPFAALVLPLAALLSASPGNAAPTAGEVARWADSLVSAYLARHQVAGATLAVVVPGDAPVVLKGYGVADAATGRPVDPQETLFMLGSISKVFTGIAALQQVEKGDLDLDSDINRWLTGWQLPATFPQPVTLRHLLTHSAGFAEISRGTRAASLDAVLTLRQRLASTPSLRERPPGERAAYTNYNAALVGLLVEETAGMEFARYVEEAICAPLGMRDTFARQELSNEATARLAAGHSRGPSGAHLPQPRELADPIPPGGILSTAADMARFAQALLAPETATGAVGRSVLTSTTLRSMLSPQFSNDPRAGHLGYFWWLWTENGQRVVSHGGRNRHFRAGLWLLPESGVALFVGFNGVHGLPDAIWADFLRTFYPVAAASAMSGAEAGEGRSDASRYAGLYSDRRFGRTSVLRLMDAFLATRVSVNASGQLERSGVTYREVEPGVFVPLEGGRRLFFQETPQGPRYQDEAVPPVVRERMAPWEDLSWHVRLLASAGAVLLLVPGGWGTGWIWCRMRSSSAPCGRHRPRLGHARGGLRAVWSCAVPPGRKCSRRVLPWPQSHPADRGAVAAAGAGLRGGGARPDDSLRMPAANREDFSRSYFSGSCDGGRGGVFLELAGLVVMMTATLALLLMVIGHVPGWWASRRRRSRGKALAAGSLFWAGAIAMLTHSHGFATALTAGFFLWSLAAASVIWAGGRP